LTVWNFYTSRTFQWPRLAARRNSGRALHAARSVFLLCLIAMWLCPAGVAGQAERAPIIYHADFETGLDFAGPHAGVSSERARSGKHSLKLDMRLAKGIIYSLKTSLSGAGAAVKPGRTYLVEGYFLPVKLPYHYNYQSVPKVGLSLFLKHNVGDSWGGQTQVDFLTPLSTPQEKWTYEVIGGRRKVTSVAPADDWIPIRKAIAIEKNRALESLVIYIYGHFASLSRELTDEEARRCADAGRVSVKDYPRLDKTFVFGVENGSFGCFSATCTRRTYMCQQFPQDSWNAVWDWKKHYVNINTVETGQMRPYNREQDWPVFAREIDVYERNNIYTLPSVWFNRYFFSNFTPAECEAAIRAAIPKYRGSKTILAWWLMSETHFGGEGTSEGLFARKIIESVDDMHPTVIGDHPELNPFHPQHMYTVRRSSLGFGAYAIAPRVRRLIQRAPGPVWAMLQGDESDTSRRKPTVAEIRMMTHAALAEGAKGITYYLYRYPKPRWLPEKAGRFSRAGVVNCFGEGRDVWATIGELGKEILPVGPLLMDAGPRASAGLVELPKRQVAIPAIISKVHRDVRDIPADFPYPVINAGLLADRRGRWHILVVYSNELSKAVKESIGLGENLFAHGERLFDLVALKPVPLENRANSRRLVLNLQPGDGRLFMIATDKAFSEGEAEINRGRFYCEKEILKYELYQARLSGIEPGEAFSRDLAEMVRAAKEGAFADACLGVDRCRLQLRRVLNADTRFHRVERQLAKTLKALSNADRDFSRFIEAQVEGAKKPIRFAADDPLLKSYTLGLDKLGRCYLACRTLFLKGAYRDIADDADRIAGLSETYLSQLKRALDGKGTPLSIDLAQVGKMRVRLDVLRKRPPEYPQPDEICEVGYFR